MLTVTELLGEAVEVEAPFGDKMLSITVQTGAFTAELEDEYSRRMEENRPIDALAKMLSALVVDWNVTDARGRKIRPTYAFLRKLGIPTLTKIMAAIQEAAGLSDEAETVKNSAGGSSLAPR